MCESSFREATDRTVTLEDEDPFIVAHAIYYLYVGRILLLEQGHDGLTYSTSIRQIGQFSDLKDHEGASHQDYKGAEKMLALLYAFGEKFLVPGLKREAYLEFFQMHYPPLAPAILTRSRKAAGTVTLIGPEWLEEHKDVIKAIFQTTPDSDRGLRDVVILTYHIWDRFFGGVKSEVIRELFCDCPDFAFGVISKPLRPKLFGCSKCEAWVRILGPQRCSCSDFFDCKSNKCAREDAETWRCPLCQGCSLSPALDLD